MVYFLIYLVKHLMSSFFTTYPCCGFTKLNFIAFYCIITLYDPLTMTDLSLPHYRNGLALTIYSRFHKIKIGRQMACID